MEQSSDDLKKESKPDDNIQSILEQNRINTLALKKLLKFIEEKKPSEVKSSIKSHDKVIHKSKK